MLRPKQQEVLSPLRDRYIHADPPGTGKTPVGWSWIKEHEAERTLIVAPTNVLRHWQNLGPKWYPGVDVHVIGTGVAAQKRRLMHQDFAETTGPKALVVPYSVLRQDQAALMQHSWDAFLCDEAHRLKGRDTLVHKAAVKIARRTAYAELATGSPILNSADEAWSAMHILEPKKWPSFWRWAGEHFKITLTDFGGKLPRPVPLIGDPFPGALEAIRSDLGLYLVMRPEEYVLPELPPVTETFYEVDLSPAERRVYNALAKKKWAQVGNQVLIAVNEVSKMTRLQQLAAEWDQVFEEVEDAGGTKVTAAAELIQDLQPHPVVVFTKFKGTAKKLVDVLLRSDIQALRFDGDLREVEREVAKARFIAGEAQVLIGTFATLAEGADGLQSVSHHVVMIDREWTPELNRQAVGRLRRDGQEAEQVFVHHIIARDTIDQTVGRALEEKQDVIEAVVGTPQR